MKDEKIDAILALRSNGRFLVGRDRIKILEAVAKHGSINKAAKETGFSYKAAWDAVDAINNLLPSPAFVTKAGGRSGGGALVTEEGQRLISTFQRLEARLAQISTAIAEDGFGGQADFLLWSLGIKISTRNVFRAEVVSVARTAVDVDVELCLSNEHRLHSVVTNDAAEELALAPGRKALALIKSSFVQLGAVEGGSEASANRFVGTITRRIDAERNSEFLVDIGGGKTMTAVIPRIRAEALSARENAQVEATFVPQNVILAVD